MAHAHIDIWGEAVTASRNSCGDVQLILGGVRFVFTDYDDAVRVATDLLALVTDSTAADIADESDRMAAERGGAK